MRRFFVAVLGASSFTYCEATWSQTLPDWIGAHVRMFRFFGGVPRLVVPDNLKSGVNRASFYDPEINLSYGRMAAHAPGVASLLWARARDAILPRTRSNGNMHRQHHELAVDKLSQADKDRKPYKLRYHIGFLIHDVARLRGTTIDKALRPLGITRSQWWLLVCLSQFEGGIINQRQLATSMQATGVAVGELLSLLSTAGYVRRRVDTGDRRQKLIVLTDHGYDVLKRSRQVAAQINKQILKGVQKEDLEAAERTLRQMRATILAQVADT